MYIYNIIFNKKKKKKKIFILSLVTHFPNFEVNIYIFKKKIKKFTITIHKPNDRKRREGLMIWGKKVGVWGERGIIDGKIE